MKRILYILTIALSLLACREEIDKSNRYTFTGETVADFMLNRSEKYSHMISLMKRAKLLSLLNTYGQYTLFLPDNEAVEKYIDEKDSIYWATKETDTPIWTGITSPLVEELSDSMANVIARSHLVEGNYPTASFDDGALPHWNFYDRYLGISYEPTIESFYIKINAISRIIDSDNKVENGVIHMVDKVIESTNDILPEQIAKYSFFGLFSEALNTTGYRDSLLLFIDENYTPLNIDHPQKKYYKYTGFIETDEVFNAAGIYTLADLRAFAEKWYGIEDRDNPKSPRNALYKFVAYHFVPRELTYNKIIPLKIGEYALTNIVVPGHDCYDYFETMMGQLMKVTKPMSSADGKYIYINRQKEDKVYNNEMRRHLNVRIIELTEFMQTNEEYSKFDPYATNGVIQPIDKILVYNEDEMSGNILNERLRFDFCTMLPELSCNNIRYNTSMYVPFSYCKNIVNKSNSSNNFYYVPYPTCYMSDFILQSGMFDVSFRLPPVPQRTYEIRLGFDLNNYEDKRLWPGVIQPYIDDKVCSLPIDLTVNNNSLVWKDDAFTSDNGVEFDKYLRSIGYMKAPDAFKVWSDGKMVLARASTYHFRKIITKANLLEGEHWIRFRLLDEMANKFRFDYIELVPLHIVNNPVIPEDGH